MSLAMTIVMLIAAWVVVAGAMLWGVMRIARRHHQPQYSSAEVDDSLELTGHTQPHVAVSLNT